MYSTYTVLLDACVLYPAQLRDVLLSLAQTGLFRARWTDRIQEEWIAALLRQRPDLTRERLQRTREAMDAAVLDAVVTGYEEVSGPRLPDPGDQHILNAAIKGGVDAIITLNLRHFPESVLAPLDIIAQHPDDFVVCQIGLDEVMVVAALREQRLRLSRPPLNAAEFLSKLEGILPETTRLLRSHIEDL